MTIRDGKPQTVPHIGEIIKKIRKAVEGAPTPVSTEISTSSRDPYQVLVSCLLSLRTKDTITGPVSEALFKVASTPKAIAKMPLPMLEKHVKRVNYYKTKARRIKDISKLLVEEYNGKVPTNFEELMKFKGVGRKTANIVMVYGHFSKDHIPVDIHVHRIPNRLGWIKTRHPEETEEQLKQIIPKKYWMDINDLLVQFGQNICLPVSPLCSKCPISKYCEQVGVTKSR